MNIHSELINMLSILCMFSHLILTMILLGRLSYYNLYLMKTKNERNFNCSATLGEDEISPVIFYLTPFPTFVATAVFCKYCLLQKSYSFYDKIFKPVVFLDKFIKILGTVTSSTALLGIVFQTQWDNYLFYCINSRSPDIIL